MTFPVVRMCDTDKLDDKGSQAVISISIPYDGRPELIITKGLLEDVVELENTCSRALEVMRQRGLI